ncbi:hypothetical protein V8G54_015468 [Vigna mungo]|uniref:Uncharacterized protein n=1 Tax=Vigna mungo TaxID=3915 RepID=A0AAQ3RZJ2_VIGMU
MSIHVARITTINQCPVTISLHLEMIESFTLFRIRELAKILSTGNTHPSSPSFKCFQHNIRLQPILSLFNIRVVLQQLFQSSHISCSTNRLISSAQLRNSLHEMPCHL